jgi:hypothetical protein
MRAAAPSDGAGRGARGAQAASRAGSCSTQSATTSLRCRAAPFSNGSKGPAASPLPGVRWVALHGLLARVVDRIFPLGLMV